MIIPPPLLLIVSTKRWLKVAAVVLPCLCLIGGIAWSHHSWLDEGVTDEQWAMEAGEYDPLDSVDDQEARWREYVQWRVEMESSVSQFGWKPILQNANMDFGKPSRDVLEGYTHHGKFYSVEEAKKEMTRR